jgi:hypothetical protein
VRRDRRPPADCTRACHCQSFFSIWISFSSDEASNVTSNSNSENGLA